VRLQLVGGDAPETADVVLIDGADAKVMKWVGRGGLPQGKTLIQVDGAHTPAIALHLRRPVSWPSLPHLVQQALGHEAAHSSRVPLSTF
jgi:hypothetical protein